MDSNEVEAKQNMKDQLKHLGFIKKIALKFLMVLSNVYTSAKENSGVLKTTIISAENAVVFNMMPVYEKFMDLPEQTLVLVDDKFDKHAPALAKNLFARVQSLTDQLFNITNSLLKEYPVLRTVYSAAQNIVKEAQLVGTKSALQSAYMSFKIVGIPVTAQLWYEVKHIPLIHALGEVIEPVAEHLFEWYNKVVKCMDKKGYSLFGYLPLVPIDEMKAAYKLVKTTMDGLSAVGDLVSRDE